MRLFPIRFKIRGLMIGIGVIAVLLALPDPTRGIVFALSLACLAIYGAWRLHARDLRGAAGWIFWSLAILINVVYVPLCAYPGLNLLMLIMAGGILGAPTIAGLGIAWAMLATKPDGDRRPSPYPAWLSVIALTLMPLATAWTAWPFQLRFLLARPALQRMADRVAAGQVITTPQWAGPFLIVKSAVDPTSGNVGLMTDPSPNGPSGFVRARGPWAGQYGCSRPFRGDWYHLDLVGGWCYHEED